MVRHWVVKSKKKKGRVVTGKERDKILEKFDKWMEQDG